MTATTRPPRHTRRSSWMDSLGFTDSRDTWSDGVHFDVDAVQVELHERHEPARNIATEKRGRHERVPEEPDPFEGWAPQPIVRRLERGNIRWTSVLAVVVLLAGLGGALFWFGYEQPRVAQRQAVQATAVAAEELSTQLSAVPTQPDSPNWDAIRIDAIETAARRLFDTAGALPEGESQMRAAAIAASNHSLETVRLLNEANGYRNAATVVLAPPALQTDPELVALDEAARSFGEWQTKFEAGLSVLSSNEFAEVDRRLETLSARLPVALQDYVDALREDDMTGAQTVVGAIADELEAIGRDLNTSLDSTRARIAQLAADATSALVPLVD